MSGDYNVMIWRFKSKWPVGEQKEIFMYTYVEDKEFLRRIRNLCGEIMQDLCHYLKEDYDIGSIFYLVGSGARNLIDFVKIS